MGQDKIYLDVSMSERKKKIVANVTCHYCQAIRKCLNDKCLFAGLLPFGPKMTSKSMCLRSSNSKTFFLLYFLTFMDTSSCIISE